MVWCKTKAIWGNTRRLLGTCCNSPMARSRRSILWECLSNLLRFITRYCCPLRHTPRPLFPHCTALWLHEWNRYTFSHNAQWHLRLADRDQGCLCTFLRLRLFYLACKFKSILCKLIPQGFALFSLFCTFMKFKDRLIAYHPLCRISRNS
jgi:hypothetical protein